MSPTNFRAPSARDGKPHQRNQVDRGAGVSWRQSGTVVTLTVGNGQRRNALGRAGWHALERAAQQLGGYEDLRAVVLRGSGGTFCAGFDMREWADANANTVDESFRAMEAALRAVEQIPVPTVAIIEGVAAGAGCELALSCDLRVMAASALIGMPILRLGVLPSPIFALRLTSLAGPSRTRELLFTGRLVSAESAERYGLVSLSVQDTELNAQLGQLLATITAHPRSGLVAAKAATAIELDRLHEAHLAPGWCFSDPDELHARVMDFLRIGSPKNSIKRA